jgi:hypothetical protein
MKAKQIEKLLSGLLDNLIESINQEEIKTIIKEETETHKTFLTMDDILRGIKSLAKSQGYYGRLYNTLMDLKENNPEQYDEIVNEFESQEFHDIVDFVMWIES